VYGLLICYPPFRSLSTVTSDSGLTEYYQVVSTPSKPGPIDVVLPQAGRNEDVSPDGNLPGWINRQKRGEEGGRGGGVCAGEDDGC